MIFSKRYCWGFTYSWMWRRAAWSVVYYVSSKGSGFETTATTHLPQTLIFQWRLIFQKNPVTAWNVTTNVTTTEKSWNYYFLFFPWFMSLKPEIFLSALQAHSQDICEKQLLIINLVMPEGSSIHIKSSYSTGWIFVKIYSKNLQSIT